MGDEITEIARGQLFIVKWWKRFVPTHTPTPISCHSKLNFNTQLAERFAIRVIFWSVKGSPLNEPGLSLVMIKLGKYLCGKQSTTKQISMSKSEKERKPLQESLHL